MKQYKFIFAVFMLCLLFSCKHDGGEKGGDVEQGDPSLSVAEMYIHFQKVENDSVTISWPEINTFDIIAKFNYANTKGEEIPVVMESSPLTITKDEEISLSVPAVAGKYKEWKGKVKIKKIDAIPTDKDVIDSVVFSGRRDKGVLMGPDYSIYQNIEKGGYPTVEMKGDLLQFLVGHKRADWISLHINGENVPVNKKLGLWKSGCALDYDILKLNSVIPILVEVNMKDKKGNEKKACIHFKIKHIEGTTDIPDLALYVNDTKVSIMEGLKNLADSSWPVFNGVETTKCVILWKSDDVAECNINTKKQEIKTEKDSDGTDVWFVEYNATDCTTEGKEVTVELKSKNPKLFHDVKWEFKVKKI